MAPTGSPEIMTIFDKRLLFVGGKGGVGKTSLAAALSLLALEQGGRVLLVAIESLDRLPRLFGCEAIGHDPRHLQRSLFAAALDPQRIAIEFFEAHIPIRALAKRLAKSQVFQYWFEATPMLRELLTLGKIWRLAEEKGEDGRPLWDRIIVDLPATGHSLGLLRSSEVASQLLVGPMRSKADDITAMLRDPEHTALAIATIAEETPVSEALELEGRARDEIGLSVEAFIINAMPPRLITADDAAALELPGPTDVAASALAEQGHPAPRAAAEAARDALLRRRSADRHRAELEREGRAPVLVVPWIINAAFGLPELEQMRDCLGYGLESERGL